MNNFPERNDDRIGNWKRFRISLDLLRAALGKETPLPELTDDECEGIGRAIYEAMEEALTDEARGIVIRGIIRRFGLGR